MSDVTYPPDRLLARPATGARRIDGTGVRLWLYAMAVLVALMVLVGGATRLTDSGLSITEWAPLKGALPPLSAADWQAAFDAYKTTTEYAEVNSGMSLEAFRTIFWWEWGHRFLGRLIGLAFLLPFLFFWLTGWLSRAILPRLTVLFALGGFQGAVGWWMVKSGLVDRVDVSQYRLAVHLTIACLIFAAILWVALGTRTPARPAPRAVRVGAAVVLAAVLLQIFIGGLVAGLDAGLVYNTWPLMDGAIVPAGLFGMGPWRSLFEDVKTVQFIHRMWAYAVIVLVVANQALVVARSRSERRLVTSASVLGAAALAQAIVGILTLWNGAAMNWGLAHQAGALLLLAAATWHLHLSAGRLPYAARSRHGSPLRTESAL